MSLQADVHRMRARSAARFIVSRPRCGRSCERAGAECTFQVAWAINPHMQVGSVRGTRAVMQHRTLVETLGLSGAIVEEVPFVHGAFDSVFSKDNAVLVERRQGNIEAFLARPRHAERQVEQHARAEALRGLGVDVVATSNAPLEGGDIVVLPGAQGAFLGHGFRSSVEARGELRRFIGHDVTCVGLRDPRLYHLDMALTVLHDGTALVCEEALDEDGLRRVQDHPAITSVLRVPLDEALRFGVNLVQVDDVIVWGADAPATSHALRRRGYRMERIALDQFHRAGGSAACLVSRVHRQASDAIEKRRLGKPSPSAALRSSSGVAASGA